MSGKRRGVLASLSRGGLWLASLCYALGIRLINKRFDKGRGIEKADVPVISIGNLTTGGTGKTPLVCYVAAGLRAMEMRVTILSRGYGSPDGSANDEALELDFRLPDIPHLQSPNRKEIAQIAVNELGAEVLLLDDGFQHRRLKRDVDVVVVDATNPFGYGFLLPRGLLREPISSLIRADVVVLNRCNLVSPDRIEAIKKAIRSCHASVPIAQAHTVATHLMDVTGNQYAAADYQDERVVAFCGIGNPESFRATLGKMGVEVEGLREFPDHHAFTREDILGLIKWASGFSGVSTILCTHKDLVKVGLAKIGDLNLRAVVVSTKIKQREKQFWSTIHSRMQQRPQ